MTDVLEELAIRCETEEGNWRLTCEIEAAITPGAELQDTTPQGGPIFLRLWGKRDWRPPAYTTDEHAALSLVPRDFCISMELRQTDKFTSAFVGPDLNRAPWLRAKEYPCGDSRGYHGSLPRAICAAALRARAAMAKERLAGDAVGGVASTNTKRSNP